MPELPEVERARRGLQAELAGRRLTRVWLRRTDLRWPIDVAAVTAMQGRRLAAVERRGKYLLLHAGRPPRSGFLVHLGMSGRILVAAAGRDPTWVRHEHWRMRFGSRTVRYIDPRRFGALLAPAGPLEDHPLLRRLGPDPLHDGIDPGPVFRRTRNLRTTLKAFLLDGRNIAGIGNIYACETCFEAGILPQTRVHRLGRAAWARICDALGVVLARALAAGGTTLRDWAGPDGEPGGYQGDLMVYGRDGQPCRVCGNPVKVARQSGRSSFYCARCQQRRPPKIRP